MNKKFEFFLNAVHYCIYLEEIWSMKKVDNCVLRIMYYLSVLFFLRTSTIRKWMKERNVRTCGIICMERKEGYL